MLCVTLPLTKSPKLDTGGPSHDLTPHMVQGPLHPGALSASQDGAHLGRLPGDCEKRRGLSTGALGQQLSRTPGWLQSSPSGPQERGHSDQTLFNGSAPWEVTAPSQGRSASINPTYRNRSPPLTPIDPHLTLINGKKKSRVASGDGIKFLYLLLWSLF